jgi:hypothetical protein
VKKEFLDIARKNDISQDVATAFADAVEKEGYVLAKAPNASKLNVQPAKTPTPDPKEPVTKT